MVTASVEPDGVDDRKKQVYAIVADGEILDTWMAGHLRESDEPHAGKWAYPFSTKKVASSILAVLRASGHVSV